MGEYFADKDHVWINGRQYISLKRVGEMMKEKRKTNADRIRAMSDEELAEWVASKYLDCPPGVSPAPLGCDDVCKECWLDWLKKEATNDQNNS